MSSRSDSSSDPVPPAPDEWGMWDPEQAGLAALFERLDPRQRAAAADRDAAAARSTEDAARLPNE